MTEPNWLIAPDRATHYSPEANGNWPCFWRLEHGAPVRVWPIHNGRLNTLDGVEISAIDLATRAALIARPTNQVGGNAEWNGVGLPPVGTVCEGYAQGLDLTYTWRKCTVLHANKEECAVMLDDSVLRWCDQFRPIRTPEQIAEEIREASISEMAQILRQEIHGFSTPEVVCAIFYDAGYRKLTLS